MARQDVRRFQSVPAGLPAVCEPGTIPDGLRRQVSTFFLDVVRLRDQLTVGIRTYRELAAAVQACADEIEGSDRAVLETDTGFRLVLDLLLDIAHQIGEATGWEPHAVSRTVARNPRAAWPETAWPLPTGT